MKNDMDYLSDTYRIHPVIPVASKAISIGIASPLAGEGGTRDAIAARGDEG